MLSNAIQDLCPIYKFHRNCAFLFLPFSTGGSHLKVLYEGKGKLSEVREFRFWGRADWGNGDGCYREMRPYLVLSNLITSKDFQFEAFPKMMYGFSDFIC